MDLIDRLADKIEARFALPTGTVAIDILKDKSPSVAIMIPPSTPTDFYLDKTIQHNVIVVVKVKEKSQRTAIQKCSDYLDFIADLEDLASSDDSFEFLGASIYSNVAFVSKTEKDDLIYSGSAQLQIYTH